MSDHSDPAPPSVIEIQRTSKHYGRKVAVDTIDLRLPRGAVCGLVGANGAGKTTTLKMLLGIVRPTSGTIHVLGLNPWREPLQIRQRLGYVPESHFIYPWMRVTQVFGFASRIYERWNWNECDRLTALLGVPKAQPVKTLSRGQLAKVALIMALAHQPELLILDEPTSGLDPVVRREFLDVLGELVRQRNCSILFSTHILPDVERLADQVVILDAGRIVAHDTVEALRSRYVKASLLFRSPPQDKRTVPQALRVERAMREWVAVFPAASAAQVRDIAANLGADDCLVQPAGLDDVYFELVDNHRATDGTNGESAE